MAGSEKYCRQCGSELGAGLKFCEKCGAPLAATAVATAAVSGAAAPAAAPSVLTQVKGAGAVDTTAVRGVVDDGDAIGRPVKKRSYVFIYWAIIAVICLVIGVKGAPILILVGILAAAYSVYIYRGGRWVFWIGVGP